MKQKKNKTKLVIISLVAVLSVIGIVFLINEKTPFEKAQTNTDSLESMEMSIVTLVTTRDETAELEEKTDQTLKVEGRGTKDVKYEISTVASRMDTLSNHTVSQESSMIYHKATAYQKFPNYSYAQAVDEKTGEENLENVINIISVPYDKMVDATRRKEGDETVYTYKIEWADVSEAVKETLTNAIENTGLSFSMDNIEATATVKDDFVIKKSLRVVYISSDGTEITLEIKTELKNKEAKVRVPEEGEYPAM